MTITHKPHGQFVSPFSILCIISPKNTWQRAVDVLRMGSVMGGYSAMHTWAVTTMFADERKRSSFFMERARGYGLG